MIRIIAGELRGRKLETPVDERVRPTSDRVKESLFNILQDRVRNARVLDVFSGTGNLGIESWSRGAQEVWLADFDKKSIQLITANTDKLGITKKLHIIYADYAQTIRTLSAEGTQVDIVFLDPPYAAGIYENSLHLLFSSGIIAQGGIAVAEHPTEMVLEGEDGLYRVRDRRKYGATSLSFLEEDR